MNLINVVETLIPIMVKENSLRRSIENSKDEVRRERLMIEASDLSSYKEMLESKIVELTNDMGLDELQEEIDLINIRIGSLSINNDLLDERTQKAEENKERVFNKDLFDLEFEYNVIISECNMKKEQIDEAIGCYYRVVEKLVDIKNKKRKDVKQLTLNKPE